LLLLLLLELDVPWVPKAVLVGVCLVGVAGTREGCTLVGVKVRPP
jgi:hypothetical protein